MTKQHEHHDTKAGRLVDRGITLGILAGALAWVAASVHGCMSKERAEHTTSTQKSLSFHQWVLREECRQNMERSALATNAEE